MLTEESACVRKGEGFLPRRFVGKARSKQRHIYIYQKRKSTRSCARLVSVSRDGDHRPFRQGRKVKSYSFQRSVNRDHRHSKKRQAKTLHALFHLNTARASIHPLARADPVPIPTPSNLSSAIAARPKNLSRVCAWATAAMLSHRLIAPVHLKDATAEAALH